MKQPHTFFILSLIVGLCYGASIPLRHHLLRHPKHNIAKPLESGTSSISLEYFTLGAFIANVTIGQPEQTFSVVIDTGSSNIAVPGLGCGSCGTSNQYNPKESSTVTPVYCDSVICQTCRPANDPCNSEAERSVGFAKYAPDQCVFGPPFCSQVDGNCGFGISYGGGSTLLGGSYVNDLLCFADICGNVTVGLIYDEYPPNWMVAEEGSVGILGLASPFNACNPSCVTTLLDAFIEQQLLSQNLFGLCLDLNTGEGVLDLGESVSSRYSPPVVWAAMEVDRWYNLIVEDMLVGKFSLGLPPFAYATTNDVIGSFVDSGTGTILTSPLTFQTLQEVFQANYGNLPGVSGNSGLFGPSGCISAQEMGNQLENFPDVVFVVKGVNGDLLNLSVPAQSYLIAANETYCMGIMPTIGVGLVFGDLFMQNFYIIFDRENLQLGFAPVASCTL